MTEGLVSIIIPFYNQAEYIADVLESVCEQTYEDIEVIVVDDGSTADSAAIANRLLQQRTSRIKHGGQLIHQDNGGLSSARNTGIRHSRGEYIICLDADDRIAQTYLARCVSHLKSHPETKVVLTRCRFFGTSDAELPMSYDPESFRWGNSITSASMYRRTTYDSSPGYDEALRFGHEDWDFYLSIIHSKSDVHIVDEPLFFYRRKPKNVASMVNTIEDHAQQTLRHIYNNHHELYAADAD